MKKFTIIERNAKNELNEVVYFAENSADVKALKGFVTITKTERVKHPSPEVMQRVLLKYQLEKTIVDLAKFYGDCEEMAAALEKSENKPKPEMEKISKNA